MAETWWPKGFLYDNGGLHSTSSQWQWWLWAPTSLTWGGPHIYAGLPDTARHTGERLGAWQVAQAYKAPDLCFFPLPYTQIPLYSSSFFSFAVYTNTTPWEYVLSLRRTHKYRYVWLVAIDPW